MDDLKRTLGWLAIAAMIFLTAVTNLVGSARTDLLELRIQRAEARAQKSPERCSWCNGLGEVDYVEISYDGATKKTATTPKPCESCRGSSVQRLYAGERRRIEIYQATRFEPAAAVSLGR